MLLRSSGGRGTSQYIYDDKEEAITKAIEISKRVGHNVTVILTHKKEYFVESPGTLIVFPEEELIGRFNNGKLINKG